MVQIMNNDSLIFVFIFVYDSIFHPPYTYSLCTLLQHDATNVAILLQAVAALGSFACNNGNNNNNSTQQQFHSIVATALLPLLFHSDLKLVEATVRSLKLYYEQSAENSGTNSTYYSSYTSLPSLDMKVLVRLVELLTLGSNSSNDAINEYAARLLASCVVQSHSINNNNNNNKQDNGNTQQQQQQQQVQIQHTLAQQTNAVSMLVNLLLNSKYAKAQEAALAALGALCFQNTLVAKLVAKHCEDTGALEKILTRDVRENRRATLRLHAVKWFVKFFLIIYLKLSFIINRFLLLFYYYY